LVYFQLFQHASVAEFQTGWFVLSIFAELALILSIRSSRSLWKSPALSVPLTLGISVAAVLPFVFVYTAGLSKVFQFTALSFNTIATLLTITFIYICANEFAKHFMRRGNLYNKPVSLESIFKTN
jgi:magnesium-transporting ATPase (P-type)